jgi:RNA polymerase sigma-70 factor (ECF subfamily)
MPEQAFLPQLNAHRGIVFKIARLYAEEMEEQQDLYQEMVYQALKSWPRFEGRAQFSTWLYRVCLNTALSWRRNEQRRQSAEAQTEWYEVQDPIQQAQTEWLYAQMRRLEPLSRMVLSLKLDGYSMAEIAEMTGLSINNATVKAHRAKQQLTSWLQQHPLPL